MNDKINNNETRYISMKVSVLFININDFFTALRFMDGNEFSISTVSKARDKKLEAHKLFEEMHKLLNLLDKYDGREGNTNSKKRNAKL